MIQKINQTTAQPEKPKMKKLDAQFMVLILLMATFGLIMVFSASYPAALHKFDNSYHFIIRQAIFAVLGIIAMYILSFIDYHLYQKLVFVIFGVGIILLLLVLVIGTRLNGAKRWINLGFTTFQPSDYVKFALIAMFAHLATINHKKMNSFQYGVMPFGICIAIVCALMMLQPHLSGTIIMIAIGGVMMFIAGTQFRYFGGLIAIAGAALGGIFLLDKGYMASRIDNWLHPLENISSGNWQTVQSLIAIGSGGFLGRGLGSSYQKFLYLPEPYNDFIFAIICEELGLIGGLIVITMFIVFTFKGYKIAKNAPDRFGFMLAVGIVTHICVQAILNIAVVTNTIPNTGISLPFFSYGGTALLMQFGEMGILLNISRHSKTDID